MFPEKTKTIALTLALALLSSAFAVLHAEEPPIDFKPTQVLATVDSETILAGDVLLWAIAQFNKVKAKTPPKERESRYRQAVAAQVKSLVKVKLLYLQAKRQIPDDKLPGLVERIGRDFDHDALDEFLESTGCATRQELENKLKPMGSSIERVRRNFVESQLAEQWFHDQTKADDIEVASEDALARYRQNLTAYDRPARARYDELVMKPSDRRSERQARAALAQMGDSVAKGAPWSEVAKARSEGTTADEGGRQPWINEGSHRSPAVDRALFSLPVGEMSPILNDDRGFYIVRVIEREPAGRIPFSDVEAQIVAAIKRERLVEKQVETMKRLFAEARIWNMFDAQNAAVDHPGTSSRGTRRQ